MLKLNLQYFSEEPEAPETPELDDKPTVDEPENKPDQKTFTQAELDDILAKRLERERKKFGDYDDIKSKLTEIEKADAERKKAEMSEIDRLQAEKEEAENRVKEYEEKSNQALTKANERLMKSEFRLIAKEIGVRSDALDDAFVLADLSSAEVDDDGNVIGVKEALEALKESKGYLFASKQYADPSLANSEPKRESSKDSMKKKLEELESKARKSGRIEDKVAYASYKRELGL